MSNVVALMGGLSKREDELRQAENGMGILATLMSKYLQELRAQDIPEDMCSELLVAFQTFVLQ